MAAVKTCGSHLNDHKLPPAKRPEGHADKVPVLIEKLETFRYQVN